RAGVVKLRLLLGRQDALPKADLIQHAIGGGCAGASRPETEYGRRRVDAARVARTRGCFVDLDANDVVRGVVAHDDEVPVPGGQVPEIVCRDALDRRAVVDDELA